MEKLVLFCKSYDKDMYRAGRLAESIKRFNVDDIPFYMSTPSKDAAAFKKHLRGIPCSFLTDEEILAESHKVFGKLPDLYPPHLMQQLIKLEFWRMDLCKNYAWLDSDSYFIREFGISDFMFDKETPYTVQNNYAVEDDEKRWAKIPEKARDKRIKNKLEQMKKFRGLFNNPGEYVDFGCSTPIIWSCRVLRSLYEDYLLPKNQSIFELLYEYPCEVFLYGEFINYSKAIPIHTIRHMFRNFDYADEFIESQMMGEWEYSIAEKHFGICIQTNWTSVQAKKTLKNRLKRRFDELKIALGKLKFS